MYIDDMNDLCALRELERETQAALANAKIWQSKSIEQLTWDLEDIQNRIEELS